MAQILLAIVAGDYLGCGGLSAGAGTRMTTRILGVLILLGAPAALAYWAGFNEAAHYVGLGAVLALQLSLFARPVAGFSVLLPMVYAAAAITAQSTDGVVALIVAIAAAVGAASSQGLHRGLVALLAAALIGSFEPAAGADVLRRAGFLLAGATYGSLLAATVLRGLHFEARHLHPQSALGYAVLLATVTAAAWFAARLVGIAHPWWLPLVIVATSNPFATCAARDAVVRITVAATASMMLVFVTDVFDEPFARGALLLVMLSLALTQGGRRPAVLAVLVAPVLVLASSHAAPHAPPLEFLGQALVAFVPVLALSGLGHWLFWTLRSREGRVTA
jgi:hypothetical protein